MDVTIARPEKALRLSFHFVLISLACVGLLSNGCMVMRSEHFSKPSAANVRVRDKSKSSYSKHLEFHGFDLDVSATDSLIRWEAGFFFWVLPIPYEVSKTTTLTAQLSLLPRIDGIMVNPWKTFYVATNETRVGPIKVWQDNKLLGTNSSNAVMITNQTLFSLEYGFQCDPDIPFELFIEGISVSGDRTPLSVPFKPAQNTRLEFALPY